MPPLFGAILNSAVIGIYDKKIPVCTAVFFSPTRALTAYHDATPVVGTVLTGASSPAEKPVRKWKFKVVTSSPRDDLVILEIETGPTPIHFLPITGNKAIGCLRDTEVWLATFGISVAKMAAESPLDISLGSYRQEVKIAALGRRHFVYHINTGRGDSGGAIISKSGQLVGMHVGGWNDASPPPSPGAAAAASNSASGGGRVEAHGAADGGEADAGGAADTIKNKERAEAMGLADLGTASRESIVKLAKQLSSGGYALYLGSPAVATLCYAPSSSAKGAGGSGASSSGAGGGGAGGGGATAGKKRKPAGGDAGGASGGGAGGGGGAVKKRK